MYADVISSHRAFAAQRDGAGRTSEMRMEAVWTCGGAGGCWVVQLIAQRLFDFVRAWQEKGQLEAGGGTPHGV